MKKILLTLLALILICGCSTKETTETTETTMYAIIKAPNGEIIEGYADDMWLLSDSMVRITINGIYYRTHFSNVLTITAPKNSDIEKNSKDNK